MLANTTERNDRTKPVTHAYPDPIRFEKITPEFIAYHVDRAHRLRNEAMAEGIRRGVTAIAHGFSALLWPFASRRERLGSQDI